MDFIQGPVAERIVAYSDAQGGGISAEELAATTPLQGPARSARPGQFGGLASGRAHRRGRIQRLVLDNLSRARQRFRRRHDGGGAASPGGFRRRQPAGRFGFHRICRGGCQRPGGGLCRDLEWSVRCRAHRHGHRRGAGRHAFQHHRVGQRFPDAGDRHRPARQPPWRAWVRAVPMAPRRRCMRCWKWPAGGRWASAAICAARAGRPMIRSI